ncbi:hypothetical protein IRJ41_004676 [Triplophysa rosa]|uniref:C2H2-type domain-containing protein n=1 Tax=Triplophysa rosa TaxID=992332 RepID=A0A9W8C8R4_TRIRA|nr:hypothetical protein IRJ41_004676 [Triplophysa rosa]
MAARTETALHPTVCKEEDRFKNPIFEGTTYKCQFCSKVGEYAYIVAHMQTHEKTAVKHGGYKMYRCHSICIKSHHYHCCYCGRMKTRQNVFLNHLEECGLADTSTGTCVSAPSSASLPSSMHAASSISAPTSMLMTMTSQMCCKSVGTDLSMLDIDDFITEICQLKKEVALLEEKLRTRGDELNTEKSRHTQDSELSLTLLCYTDTNPTDAQDTVCDSNHTLNQDESTDQTSTESLDSVCNAGEQQILNTRPLNMCSVTLMEMGTQTPAEEEHHTDEDENHDKDDDDFIPSVDTDVVSDVLEVLVNAVVLVSDESGDSCCDGETASTSKQRLTAQTLSCITEGHERRHTEQKVLQEQRHHSEKHKEEKMFLCELCGRNFVSPFSLKVHMRIHTGEKSFHCSQCDKCFRIKGYLVLHQRIHTGEKPHACPHCEMRFSRKTHLNRHMRLHSDERPYECSECGKTFKSTTRKCMKMLRMTSQMCCKSVGTDLSMLDIDDFITEICQLKKEVALLEEKLRTRGDELNTEKSRHTQDSELSLTLLCYTDTNPTDAQDTVCDSNHTLNQDESTDQTSTESLDSVCNAGEQQILNTRPLNMCSVTLMEMGTQTPAEEEHHTDEDENHDKDDDDFIPSDESGDSCCDGETASTSKQRLTAQTLSCITEGHERRHTEQKVLQEQRHHSEKHKEEKMFLCELCGRNFVSSFSLKVHMRTHTGEKPFHCSQCDKCFRIKGYLVLHQRIHTGEKPHACPHCEMRFSRKTHLNRHMRLHSDERPYECSECGKTFKRESMMRDTGPNDAEDLKAAIIATWASITPEQCHRLIASMPRRIDAVIHAKGAPTKY